MSRKFPFDMKCKECGTPHKNKSEKSNYQEIGDICQRCEIVLRSLNAVIEAMNKHIPLGDTKPRRKITITGYKIDKI